MTAKSVRKSPAKKSDTARAKLLADLHPDYAAQIDDGANLNEFDEATAVRFTDLGSHVRITNLSHPDNAPLQAAIAARGKRRAERRAQR